MPHKKSKINLLQTSKFSRLIIDYINSDPKLKNFYAYDHTIDAFAQVIKDRSGCFTDRKLVSEVLSDQYHSRIKPGLSDFQKTNSNIQLLLDKNTFTVCTGHQLCLFTGPLYFIYKIISTINLAEKLKEKYPKNNFVPVYWMASEDHDFEEIKSIHLFGKTLAWENKNAKGAVGRLNTESLSPVIDELAQVLGDSENGKELIALFKNAYLKHNNLADATRYLVHEIFAEYGLVIIDADDKRLKESFVKIIRDDISNQTNFKLVNDTISQLEEIDVKPQVNPREINVFKLNSDRVRIEESSPEVLALAPEEYSPNVVLRPLYQQQILPNIAYVGGPGEIAYWLEYKAMFDHHKILFPILIPRNFALLTDEKTNQQLSKLGFSITDMFKDYETLIKEFVNRNTDGTLSLKEHETELVSVFNSISGKVALIDPTLKANIDAELQKSLNALKNIESKLLRTEKQKQETGINQIKKIREKFLPEGELQERYDNFAPYYLKYGKSFIAELKSAFEPFDYSMQIIELS